MATRTGGSTAARWCLVLTLALGACGEAEQPKEKPTPKEEVTPTPPPSPVSDARSLLEEPAEDAKALAGVLERAAELRTWADEHPEHEDAVPARVLADRLEVLGAAGALARGQEAVEAVKSAGDAPEARLRAVVERLGALEEEGADARETLAIREAALAVLAADPEVKDVELDRESALELAESTTPEGLAVRAVWAGRLAEALDALQTLPPELRVEQALARAGHLLCPRCGDARHATPDKVTAMLLSEKNADGIVCDSAVRAAKGAEAPLELTGALSTCKEILPEGASVEPTFLWSHNAILLGLVRTADRLAKAPGGEGLLAGAARERTSALSEALGEAVLLPVPYITRALPPEAPEDEDAGAEEEPPRTLPAPIADLAAGGLTVTKQALGLVLVGPQGVRVGLRPVLALQDGAPVSLGAEQGLPAGGRAVMTLPELEEATPSEEDGSYPALTSVATEIFNAEEEVAGRLATAPALGTEEGGRFVALGVDALAPGWAVAKVLEGLSKAGVAHVRFEKTALASEALPLAVRAEPEGAREALKAGYERPIIAVVAGEHVDVWAPRGAVGDPGPETDQDAEIPEGLEPGYQGVDLVRLRVPKGEESGRGLAAEDVAKVMDTVAYFQKRHGAGPLLHVVAGDGALAADVLRVADAFQRREGEVVEEPERFWPGAACGTEAHAEVHRTPEGCPTGLAVAFSATEVPSGRLRDEPRGNVAQPRPKPKPKPAAGFCDKRDITVNMNRRKGSFRFCYERELQLHEDLAGRVVVRFTIDTDGSVKSARVASSTLKSDNVHTCLLRNVKRVTFAKPEGGVCEVSWPFQFSN